MGSWYILPAHLEDMALLESNLSARWGSRRMGRAEALPFIFHSGTPYWATARLRAARFTVIYIFLQFVKIIDIF